MTSKSTVRLALSFIVIFGHLFVFLAGLSLGIFSLLKGEDAIQVLLMASPILATTAFSAFGHAIGGKDTTENEKVSTLFSILVIAFPSVLILVIFFLFGLFAVQMDNFGPPQLKIALGGVETFFGAYLGLISKSLFDQKIEK